MTEPRDGGRWLTHQTGVSIALVIVLLGVACVAAQTVTKVNDHFSDESAHGLMDIHKSLERIEARQTTMEEDVREIKEAVKGR